MIWQRLLFWRKRRDRDIFTFWDGERQRQVDPLPAWFAMSNDPECHPVSDCPKADAGDRQATCNIVGMVRRMFSIKTFDEGGLTEYELSMLFSEFMAFVAGQKKKREHFRTQWVLSVGESQDESTTERDSESSSTQSESSSEEPPDSLPPSQPPPET